MKIIITDDDRLVAASLKTIIEAASAGEITVCAVASSGEEALSLYDIHKPDIMLMDIRMGGMTGLETGEQLLKTDSGVKLLYLTTFSDDEYIIKALSMGAKGYILKQDFEGIVPALRAVMNGQSVFAEQVVSRIPRLMADEKKQGFNYEQVGIGENEREIIELVAAGLCNKEIAAKLYLSEGTVRNYLSQIFEKLSLRDRTQLAVFYYKYIK